MRLDALGLIRYGHFTDARLVLPRTPEGADLHVVFGPNEAGKSTLFSAWLDLLFGFPAQTQYGFLHDYRALRIEAEITAASGPLNLARIKGRTNTLLDAQSDQPLAEASLGAALGGLDRASYTTMFSLDDDTLEQGGESILSSEGDLGRLLFSASAGLSELSDGLRALQDEASAWFRPSGRKFTLNDHKAQLRALEAQRREVDLKASDWRKLCSAKAEAEAQYTAARDRCAATRRQRETLRRDLDALRDLARLRKREAQRAKLPPVQDLPDHWHDAMPGWQREEAELDALAPVAQARVSALEQAIAALGEDAQAEAMSGQIDELEQRFGAVTKSLEDLPKRQAEAGELRAQMTALVARLGRADLTPENALLPAATVARLGALLEEDAVLRSTTETAQAEFARAQQAMPDGPATGALDETALARLGPFVAELRRADLLRLRMDAQTELSRADSALQAAMDALAPWSGSPEALCALDLPSGAHLDALARDLAGAGQALRDAQAQVTGMRGQVAQARAGLAQAASLRPEDVADLRAARDRAWRVHRSTLSLESAEAFEQAMAADDRIRALQIDAARQGEKLARIAETEAALTTAEAARDEIAAQLAALEARVAALWSGLGIPAEHRPLADFIAWLARRDAALEALAAQTRARAEDAALRARLHDASGALSQLLDALGRGLQDADFASLLAEAEAALAEAASLRQHAARARDLAQREAALAEAQEARAIWQGEWDRLCAQSWIGTPAPEPVAMRAILDLTRALAEHHTRAGDLAQRIGRMQGDIAQFDHDLRAIAQSLDEPPEGSGAQLWPRLRHRLQAARAQMTERARLQKEHAEAQRAAEQITARRTALNARLEPLRARFGALALSEIAATLAAIAKAREIAQDCAALRDDLAQTLGCTELEPEIARLDALDVSATEIALNDLDVMLKALEAAQQDAYATLAAAQKAVDTVSHDGAAARIDAERQTLIEQISEEAQQFLARQAGIIAVEHALRRYRDTHRSSMMARASDAFAMLTGGRYVGLVTRADGADDVLMAQLAGGATKEVRTLSKGTRFQLYLALRAAGFHEFAASRPTVPFIADDIFETFDDTRSEAAFRLLGQMAQRGQVIYLTHHAHLCDIARAACPKAQIHDLRTL